MTQLDTTITVNAGTLALGGAIISAVNGVGLVKQGAGTLLLDGPGNTYAGQTRVAAGPRRRLRKKLSERGLGGVVMPPRNSNKYNVISATSPIGLPINY